MPEKNDISSTNDISINIASMTAYARCEGNAADMRWVWEIKSVNHRGFDLRFRLPPGFDELEGPIRKRITARVSRGTISISLMLESLKGEAGLRVNQTLLEEVLSLSGSIAQRTGAAGITIGELFAIKGILTTAENNGVSGGDQRLREFLLTSFDTALTDHIKDRRREGAALSPLLSAQLAQLRTLINRARIDAAELPALVKRRLETTIETLNTEGVEPARLATEVALLAAKADISEEIDRLGAHCTAAGALLASGGVIGRAFDFLTQELNREANTLCAKAQSRPLKQAGLELKGIIDQLREQIQNIE